VGRSAVGETGSSGTPDFGEAKEVDVRKRVLVLSYADAVTEGAGMGDRVTRRMTIDAFLKWQLDQAQRYELIDGEPVAMAGAKLRHDRVTGNAFSEIRRQLRAVASPCDAFTADIGIRTPIGNIRRPDISVLCPPFDEEATTSGNPRLIVEVLSESTERVDRLIKLDEYKAIEALDCIIIVDPSRIEAGFWYRDAMRMWRNASFQQADSIIEMPALGIAISLATFYERVQVMPASRLKLVWEEGGGGTSDPAPEPS
jgi:Uma2 family endonuclease